MAKLAVGDYLDNRYVIDRPIARGGMATVYRCVDTRLEREVAAKVMHEEFIHDAVFRERFRREAKAMAQLSHPNLVNVYDFSSQGEADGQIFLIMELITGGTLRELLAERGPMPPHAACAVMRQMLTGLTVAHEKGLVHRDIKPDNVLINSDHRVKLADFGLVRAVADATHTTDQIVGTVAYLSPEQVDGNPITPASDVYSAGIVLFELLTGRTPFRGETPIAHAYARLHEVVPAPSTFIQGIPKLFDELVATATAITTEDRFHNAGEFLAALNDVAAELRLAPYTVPVPKQSAANRAAAHPTNFRPLQTDLQTNRPPAPRPAPAPPRVPAAPVAPVTAAAQVAPLPEPGPENTQQPPERRPNRTPQPPHPVTNRNAASLVLFLVVVAILTGAIILGAWWTGSGMYGDIPQIIAPL